MCWPPAAVVQAPWHTKFAVPARGLEAVQALAAAKLYYSAHEWNVVVKLRMGGVQLTERAYFPELHAPENDEQSKLVVDMADDMLRFLCVNGAA